VTAPVSRDVEPAESPFGDASAISVSCVAVVGVAVVGVAVVRADGCEGDVGAWASEVMGRLR
jgi:hypothetical protein